MVGIMKDDGALPSQGLGGASEKSRLLVVLGYIGAQTWLPIVGVVADMICIAGAIWRCRG